MACCRRKRKKRNGIEWLGCSSSLAVGPKTFHSRKAKKFAFHEFHSPLAFVGLVLSLLLWLRSNGACRPLNPQPMNQPKPTNPPQEQQPNQSHSIKNKSFVFYWWIDGWTVPLGRPHSAKEAKQSILPIRKRRIELFLLSFAVGGVNITSFS